MGSTEPLARRARPWLGTIVEIGVSNGCEAAIEAGFAEIARIHRLMSFHEDASDLAKLRAARPDAVVALDPDTVKVLQIAATLHAATDGLFNVAIGRQLVRTHFLPRMDIGHLGRFDGSASDIEVVDDRHVRLHRRTLIDLGGIAKGYAVDCAVAALQAAGVARGVVNAGGDLRVFGDGAIPVEVRMSDGALSAPFSVQNCAIASSENARTRRTIKQQIVTPHIGRRARPVVADHTITVIASTCVIADAMTKVAMVDPALADRLLADHNGHVVRFALSEAA